MVDTSLQQRLEQLLSEPLDVVRARQADTLTQMLGATDAPFVLFGAGNLGRRVLALLKDVGMTPSAFIDNNPNLWGTSIEGVEVCSPAQLAERLPQPLPAVIVTIWYGEASDRMADRLAPLRALGFKRIAQFGHLAWRFPATFLPHYCLDLPEHVIADADRVRQAFALLSDDDSRQLFVDHVQWRLFHDYDLLPPASPLPIYFNDRYYSESPDEVLYDIGAYSGDSVLGYLESGRPVAQVHAFEPSAGNFPVLVKCLAQLEKQADLAGKLHAHNLAVGDTCGEVTIEASNGPSSRVGQGDQVVRITTLDQISTDVSPATLIKMDIEGFEPQCLQGGAQLIAEHHPVVTLSAYHEQNHLWSLLLQLHSYYSGYSFFLCPHVSDGWDLVLYAVPADRRVS